MIVERRGAAGRVGRRAVGPAQQLSGQIVGKRAGVPLLVGLHPDSPGRVVTELDDPVACRPHRRAADVVRIGLPDLLTPRVVIIQGHLVLGIGQRRNLTAGRVAVGGHSAAAVGHRFPPTQGIKAGLGRVPLAVHLSADIPFAVVALRGNNPRGIGLAGRPVQLVVDRIVADTVGVADRERVDWFTRVIRTNLTPLKKVARTIKERLSSVINYCLLKITNAVTEGLNSKIMSIKRRVGGFRNRENFKTAILFYCSGLDLHPR
ncbi:MAG: transposase [Planctomycetota bacterium]